MTTRRECYLAWGLNLVGVCGCLVAVVFVGCRPAPELPPEASEPFFLLQAGTTETTGNLAYSPDGELLAAVNWPNVKVWEAATGKEVVTFEAYADALTFSPDSKYLALATSPDRPREKHIREARTGKVVRSLDSGLVPTVSRAVAWSPDGRWLALAGTRESFRQGNPPGGRYERTTAGVISLFDATSGERAREIVVEGYNTGLREVDTVAFSVDSQRVAAVSYEGHPGVKVWDVTDGEVVLTLKGPTRSPAGVAFSPDGALIASSFQNFPEGMRPDQSACKVQVWHARTGEELCLLPGWQDHIRCLAFTPDGRYLATGGDDKAAKIWDITTRQLVVTLSAHVDGVWTVAFSPDGKRLATGAREVRVWDVGRYCKP